jgi:hypothetical protein
MKHMARGFLLAFLLLALSGFDRRNPSPTVTFHTETNQRDSEIFAIPVTVGSPPRRIFIEKTPSITEREIAGVYPFPADDGTLGCAFKLDQHGQIWLDTISGEKNGMTLVAFVSGRQVADLLIDRRVSDGIITLPGGLNAQDVEMLKKHFHLLGKKKK